MENNNTVIVSGRYFGYIRVSSIEQNYTRQFDKFDSFEKKNNITFYKVATEKASGKGIDDRPVFRNLMEELKEDDCLVIESYSRLSRNFREASDIMNYLYEKKIQIFSIDENMSYDSSGTTTFVRNILLSLAQLERTTILERQHAGIQKARAEGKFKGRSPILISKQKFENCYEKYIRSNRENKYTLKTFGKELGVSKTTLVNILKEYRENNTLKPSRIKPIKEKEINEIEGV
jgi:DNA invertase Pin-like site-specific DNA recombinase